jgi:hypothetical protein
MRHVPTTLDRGGVVSISAGKSTIMPLHRFFAGATDG